jgi:hypothetical protein
MDITMERTVHWIVKRDTIINRYTLADTTTGCTLDDAAGYGFKDYEKAYNYAINKYKFPPVVDERPISRPLF